MSLDQNPAGPKRSWQEELTATGDELVAQVRKLVSEGNVRRVIVKHDDRVIFEIPLTLGVVGALLAPQVAALGAVAALVTRCQLTIEREESPSDASASGQGTDLHPSGHGQAGPGQLGSGQSSSGGSSFGQSSGSSSSGQSSLGPAGSERSDTSQSGPGMG
jgi:hypothetical protein